MEQRISLITLGVVDLDRAVQFYEALGWSLASEVDGIAAFNVHGSAISLYPWAKIAEDLGISEDELGTPSTYLAHNVRTPEEVAPLLEAAKAAGASIIKPAQKVFWGGHSGLFRDPDGHMWEVACNPFSPLGPEGEFRWGGGY